MFIKMTSFDEVVIMLHKFDSNSEHTFFYPASHFRLFTQNCILRQAPHFERAPHFIIIIHNMGDPCCSNVSPIIICLWVVFS